MPLKHQTIYNDKLKLISNPQSHVATIKYTKHKYINLCMKLNKCTYQSFASIKYQLMFFHSPKYILYQHNFDYALEISTKKVI